MSFCIIISKGEFLFKNDLSSYYWNPSHARTLKNGGKGGDILKITRKRDVIHFIKEFEEFAQFDGLKHYFAFDNDTVTLMKYHNNIFTFNRINDLFCDIDETQIPDIEKFVWENRRLINESIMIKI